MDRHSLRQVLLLIPAHSRVAGRRGGMFAVCALVCRAWREGCARLAEDWPVPAGFCPGPQREVVTVQLGQAGNRVGAQFWRAIGLEHRLDPESGASGDGDCEQLAVYYQEDGRGRYLPRAVLADLDPAGLDRHRGQLYRRDGLVTGAGGAANNWAKARYGDGVTEQVLDCVRREAERCDSLQGFQLCHGLGGGTGSGLGARLLAGLRDEFGSRITLSFPVLPSPTVSDCVVEPYNAVLSMPSLIGSADGCVPLDNQALHQLCRSWLPDPAMGDLNRLAARAMAEATCSIRFRCGLSPDLRKLAANLCPFARGHFLSCSLAPLTAQAVPPHTIEMRAQLFNRSHFVSGIDPRHGRFLALQTMDRGQVSFEELATRLLSRNSSLFVEWIPNLTKSAYCRVPPPGLQKSVSLLGNSTAIQEVLRRLAAQFSALHNRRAFLHWYTAEGMDELEFAVAESELASLMDEYQVWQDATADDTDDESWLSDSSFDY